MNGLANPNTAEQCNPVLPDRWGEDWLEQIEQRGVRNGLVAITDGYGRVHHLSFRPGSSASPVSFLGEGRMLWECDAFARCDDSSELTRSAILDAASFGFARFEAQCRTASGIDLTMKFDARSFRVHGELAILIEGSDETGGIGAEPEALAAAKRLLYGASHDLQEPLRMILIYAQLLQRRHGEQLDAEAQRVLDSVIDGARRMNERMRSLLAYAQLELGQQTLPVIAPQTIPSREVLDATLRDLRMTVEESNARIDIGELPTVLAHPPDLAIVFQNLIVNAIKFRKPGDPPHIAIDALSDGGQWRFSVRDRGLGFDPGRERSLFEFFTRLHGGTSGTGLGLAICKQVVERMGGRIWAESQPGEGATFYFTLERPRL